MKNIIKTIIILVILINLPIVIRCQDEFGVDWGDPVYKSFFDGTCQSSLKSSVSKTISTIYDQLAYTSEIYDCYAYQKSSCGNMIIKNKGCNLTCLAMIMKNGANLNVNPRSLNDHLKGLKDDTDRYNPEKNGFTKDNGVSYIACQSYNGNTDINGKFIYKYNSWISAADTNTNPLEVLKTHLSNYGGWAIARVMGSDTCSHWVLVYEYTSTGTQLSHFNVINPEKGTKSTLDKFLLCTKGNVYHLFTTSSTISKVYLRANNSKNKIITVKKGSSIFFQREKITSLKSALSCEKKIWVVKDSYGKIVETPVLDIDLYTFYPQNTGTYYVSLAVSDYNGFDADVIKVIVEGNAPAVINSGSSGSVENHYTDNPCPGSNYYGLWCPGNWQRETKDSCNYCFCKQKIGEGFNINHQNTEIALVNFLDITIYPQKCDESEFFVNVGDDYSIWTGNHYYYNYFLNISFNINLNESGFYEIGRWNKIPLEYGDFYHYNNTFSFKRLVLNQPLSSLYGERLEGRSYFVSSLKYNTLYSLKLSGEPWMEYSQKFYIISDNLNRQNETLPGYDFAKKNITVSDCSVSSSQHVYLNAGQTITLDKNVTIEAGAIFEANVDTTFQTIAGNLDRQRDTSNLAAPRRVE